MGGLDLGVGGISYVELHILYELWAGERLSFEKAHPHYLRPGRPISVSAVPFGPGIDIWRSCRFIGAMMRSLCFLPGGLGRFLPCSIGANHCRLRLIVWERCGHGLTSRPRESSSVPFLNELLRLFGYPSGYAGALLVGTLPLRYLTGYVRAPCKCVPLSTSREVRRDMRDWVLSDGGGEWSVKFDARDLGGHLDTTFRGWSSTFAAWVRLVISRLVLIFALPLDFHGRVRVVRSMYLPAALHEIEASLLASDSLRKLRSPVHRVVWSRRQPLPSVGAVLSFLDGPTGCDPALCVVWFWFRLLRR